MNATEVKIESFEDFIERKKHQRLKEKKFFDIGREGHWYAFIKDIVYIPQSNNPDKYITLELLEFHRSEGKVL